MTHPLRIGLKASGQWITIEQLRAIWKIGDEGGFDHLWDFDHMASIGPNGPAGPVYEGWAMLAAMAEATKRGRIGLGIGAAWNEIEHEMYGIGGLDHRVGRLSESLQILKSLFTQEKTTFEGRYYKFK